MIIFKDEALHQNLKADLKITETAFGMTKTRIAEKLYGQLIEAISQEIACNLTVEAALEIEKIANRHPDSDIDDLIDFFVWKTSAKFEPVKDFILRTGIGGIDEDEVAQLRVYPGDFYIECRDMGVSFKYSLNLLDGRSWSEPETSLEAMELELYNFAHVLP
jgi:hypothetical protein